MWFSEYVFLERSWAKDENTLKVRVYSIKKILHAQELSPKRVDLLNQWLFHKVRFYFSGDK